jgi:transglutaminase-like putative cysteine protease
MNTPTASRGQVRIELQVDLGYRIESPSADFIFNVHAAHTRCQTVTAEQLILSQPIEPHIQTEPGTGNRYLRLRAHQGDLALTYRATIDLHHHYAEPSQLQEIPIGNLPLEVLNYIYPSRYCESDKLLRMAMKQFGGMAPGYRRVQAIVDWVRQQVSFTSNTSNPRTSAIDTLVDQVGVCRDFAHLMIALCRALNIPARFTTGTDYGADPALGPPDFHAYVEVYVGGGWYIVDPSGTGIPMGFVRLGTGRDAADVAFATMFGGVVPTLGPMIRTTVFEDKAAGLIAPQHTAMALSTDSPAAPTAGPAGAG